MKGVIMAKPIYKNRIKKTVSLDIPIAKALFKYSDETSIPVSRVLDKAVKEYFENHKIKM